MEDSDPTPRDASPKAERRFIPRRFPHLPKLSPTARILLMVLGWTMILLGLAGLVLPGLQGVLTLVLGAAALSLVSPRILRALRYLFSPWPKAWRLVLRARRRVLYWFQPKKRSNSKENPETRAAP